MDQHNITQSHHFIIKSFTPFTDKTFRATLLYSLSDDFHEFMKNDTKTIILPAAPIDTLAAYFTPITASYKMENNENCGYYFIPYDLVE